MAYSENNMTKRQMKSKLTVSVKQCGRLLILFCHDLLEDKVPDNICLLQLPLGAILRKSLILLLAHIHDHTLVADHFLRLFHDFLISRPKVAIFLSRKYFSLKKLGLLSSPNLTRFKILK